ncbi:MAG: PilZ domain-containing protein [Candidatus Aureabacteria bacterium]|nr:PilZ domain-containing protein [Candidatus Auribacterota bacterium]
MKSDNRKYKRTHFVFPVRIGVLRSPKDKKAEDYFHAFSDNISEGGLKIALTKKLESGTPLELRFDLIMDEKIHMVQTQAEVRWNRTVRKGLYEHGLQFGPLSDDDWKIVSRFMKDYCL